MLYEKYLNILRQLSPKATFCVVCAIGLILVLGLQVIVIARSGEPNIGPTLEIRKENLVVTWAWSNGYGSPSIAKNGEERLSVSAVGSKAGTEGREKHLWSHYMGATSDRDSIFSSYNRRDEYLVEQITTLVDDHTLRLSFYVTSQQYLNEFTLSVQHISHVMNSVASRDNIIESIDEFMIEIIDGEETDTRVSLSPGGNIADVISTTFNLSPESRTLVFEEILTFYDR